MHHFVFTLTNRRVKWRMLKIDGERILHERNPLTVEYEQIYGGGKMSAWETMAGSRNRSGSAKREELLIRDTDPKRKRGT